MLATVTGLSPDRIFSSTSCSVKKARVSLASGRIGSSSTSAATGVSPGGQGARHRLGRMGEKQDAAARLLPPRDLRRQGKRPPPQKDFRRADQHGAFSPEGDGTPFARRGKGGAGDGLPVVFAGKTLLQSHKGGVAVLQRVNKAADGRPDFKGRRAGSEAGRRTPSSCPG